jgi:hypothetical protein
MNASGQYTPDSAFPSSGGTFGYSSSHGSNSLVIRHVFSATSVSDGATAIRVKLCADQSQIDVSGKSVTFSVYLEPTDGTVGGPKSGFYEMNVYRTNNGSFGLPFTVYPSGEWPANQWVQFSSSLTTTGTSATDLGLEFRTMTFPWTGNVYFDDISIR